MELIRVILFVLFVSSIVWSVAFIRVKWRMHKKHKETGWPDADNWVEGYAPSDIPRSWIVEGMKVDPTDPNKVISTWRYNDNYYMWLARE
jgi:hypothetical protein